MKKQRKPVNPGVGMPHWIYLHQFGYHIFLAFDEVPYLVGSAVYGKNFRDVDVRLILPDEKFAALFGRSSQFESSNPKWASIVSVYTEFGRKLTGLPIDFQIQQMTRANKEFPHEGRNALILAIPTKE